VIAQHTCHCHICEVLKAQGLSTVDVHGVYAADNADTGGTHILHIERGTVWDNAPWDVLGAFNSPPKEDWPSKEGWIESWDVIAGPRRRLTHSERTRKRARAKRQRKARKRQRR